MKKLINGKIRNTDKLEQIACREGNPNDCYSGYSRLLHDPRDDTYYLWSGSFWAGLGPDQLREVADPIEYLEGERWTLSNVEAQAIQGILDKSKK